MIPFCRNTFNLAPVPIGVRFVLGEKANVERLERWKNYLLLFVFFLSEKGVGVINYVLIERSAEFAANLLAISYRVRIRCST